METELITITTENTHLLNRYHQGQHKVAITLKKAIFTNNQDWKRLVGGIVNVHLDPTNSDRINAIDFVTQWQSHIWNDNTLPMEERNKALIRIESSNLDSIAFFIQVFVKPTSA